MPLTYAVLIFTQLLFSVSDLMGRNYMKLYGFSTAAFASTWFVVYFLIRIVATMGQLYVFASIDLGKTMALFGAASIIVANFLGLLVLKEVLSPMAYVGISLAVVTFCLLAFSR
jgi:multidrug transporter EmrE-like cation transporter